jgi:hypothetical protein
MKQMASRIFAISVDTFWEALAESQGQDLVEYALLMV